MHCQYAYVISSHIKVSGEKILINGSSTNLINALRNQVRNFRDISFPYIQWELKSYMVKNELSPLIV